MWVCEVFDSMSTGTRRFISKNYGILKFETKKSAKEYCYEALGKEFTDECIVIHKED